MITIYTSSTCHYCKDAKEHLDKEGLDYQVKNVSDKMDYRTELMELGYRSVPVIVIDDVVLHGYDKEKLQDALDKRVDV